ncbi:MAG: hypothetical protein U0822_19055 [Anaerolineae bacterium]
MATLILKLLLTPTLIGAASLAGRRWGPALSGWFVGLPFTSGPLTFFLALSQGASFAQAAAMGTLAGGISQAAFCLTYAWLARRSGWALTLLASTLAFLVATAALQRVSLPLAALVAFVVIVLAVTLQLMPRAWKAAAPPAQPPWWDVPARMAIATTFVLILTALAPLLGPQLTGLLAPFPLYATILAAFAHQQQGSPAAASVLRGLLMGLFAFTGFFAVLAALLDQVSIPLAFAAAIIVALIIQGATLWVLQRGRRQTESAARRGASG